MITVHDDMRVAEESYITHGGDIWDYASQRLKVLKKEGHVRVEYVGCTGFPQFILITEIVQTASKEAPKTALPVKKVTLKVVEGWLKNKLRNDPQWTLKGLQIVYRNQTSEEQECQNTIHLNSVGFGSYDAEILTSFAQQVEKGWNLTENQWNVLKMKISKYWKQVLDAEGGLESLKTIIFNDLQTF